MCTPILSSSSSQLRYVATLSIFYFVSFANPFNLSIWLERAVSPFVKNKGKNCKEEGEKLFFCGYSCRWVCKVNEIPYEALMGEWNTGGIRTSEKGAGDGWQTGSGENLALTDQLFRKESISEKEEFIM